MNHINAESQGGGEPANNGESAQQLGGARREEAKNRFSFTVNWAAMGVLLGLITIYLTYAGVKHTWPFEINCPVVAGAPPNSVDEAHASGAGLGMAEVFWLPPKCVGSNLPISQYEVTAWRMIKGIPSRAIHSIVVADARTPITIARLNVRDIYSFHVSAVNSVGPSRPAITNAISPHQNDTQGRPG
jgi:hypothetical protein